MASERSFEAAMEMCDLATFLEHDPVRDHEIARARALWTKLKKPWAAKPCCVRHTGARLHRPSLAPDPPPCFRTRLR